MNQCSIKSTKILFINQIHLVKIQRIESFKKKSKIIKLIIIGNLFKNK